MSAETGVQTTKQGAVTTVKPIEELRGTLSKMKDQFKMVLPPHIDPDKFIRVVMTAVQNNPSIMDKNRSSFFSACLKCATDGLIPDSREAALVAFGEEVQYMPMVGGILKKVRNSGELASIMSQIVHKNDHFEYWVDEAGEHISHKPLMFGDRGDAIGVYGLAKTKDGAVYVEVMDKAQIMAVKGKAKTKMVWDSDFGGEMWRKSVIRRLSKRLPMSTDLQKVIERIDEDIDLDKPTAPAETSSTRLKNAIASDRGAADRQPGEEG